MLLTAALPSCPDHSCLGTPQEHCLEPSPALRPYLVHGKGEERLQRAALARGLGLQSAQKRRELLVLLALGENLPETGQRSG